MRGGPWGEADALAPRDGLPRLALLAPAVPLALAVLWGGGSDGVRLAWVGLVALLVAGGVAVAAALGAVPLPRPGREGVALLVAAGALVAWQGVTLAWSIEGDRTWETFNRGLVYLLFLGLGALAVGLAGSVRAAAAGLAAVLGAVVLWALLTAALPGLGPDTERSARLQAPVGYWNGLALLAACSLPLWLWLAAPRERALRVRAGAVVVLFLALVALGLTTSRGGILAALAGLAVWLIVGRPRLESAVALALAAIPALGVVGFAFAATSLGDAGVGASERRADGLALAAALVVVGAAVAAATARLAARDPAPAARRSLGLGLGAAALAAGVVAAAAVLVAVDVGAAWDDFRNPPQEQVTTGPGRVGELSSNHRWTWWTQAWQLFRDDPWRGTGAGSYELARRPIREDTAAPLDPHDLALTFLSETGVVGFGLLAAAVAAGAWVAASAVRRLRGDERAAAAALGAGAAAWLVQSLVDMPWQYLAASAPLFVALGALLAAGRPTRRREGGRSGLGALAAVAAVLAAAFTLASPAVAERRTGAALDALVTGDAAGAVERAGQARSLDPLAVEPVLVQASAEEIRGRLDEAERLFRHAVELQPRNPQTWYELGRFEFEARGRLQEALLYADRSYGLDSWPPDTGRLLDEIRAAIAKEG